MPRNSNEIIAEILDTVVASLPIDPADQARLRASVEELHAHNKPTKEAKPTSPKAAPNANRQPRAITTTKA